MTATEPYVLVEGEKAADAVAAAGLCAIGTVCGASSTPGPDVIRFLAARDVVLWPDNDDIGHAHMARITTALLAAGVPNLFIVRWPDAPDHGDAADTDPDTIRELVADALAHHWIGPLAGDIHSAEPETASGSNIRERFRTAAEIVAELPPAVEWILEPFVARGAITELVGRAKAAGKTTLLAHAIAAILDGRPFLGQATAAAPVVVLTEQPPTSLRAVLERADLAKRTDLHILTWRAVRGEPWPAIVAAAVACCAEIGSPILVVDTLPAFAGIRGDAENDAGAALQAIEPLQVAAADGLAVVVVRHERKGGGEVGDSARGSSAFTGAVDVVVRLARPENPARPTIRNLATLSRFDDAPPELVIELTDEGYVLLGDEAAVAFAEARAAMLDVLPTVGGLAMTEIEAAIGGKRTTIQAALAALLDTGDVVREGAGRKGSPYTWRRAPADPGIVSAVPSGRDGGRKHFPPLSVAEEMAGIFGSDELDLATVRDLDGAFADQSARGSVA